MVLRANESSTIAPRVVLGSFCGLFSMVSSLSQEGSIVDECGRAMRPPIGEYINVFDSSKPDFVVPLVHRFSCFLV